MKNKKLITLLIIYVASLSFYLFQGGRTSILIFGVLNALLLYLAFCFVIGMRNLSVQRKVGNHEQTDKQFIAEQHIPVTVNITHDNYIPLPYMKVEDEMIRHDGTIKKQQGIVVWSFSSGLQFNYTIKGIKRGIYKFKQITCSTYDVFGILELKRSLELEEKIQVLPKILNEVNWEHLLSGKRGLYHVTTQDRYAKESNQQSGIREYVHGDRLSRVHWNATARTGQWKSKDFEKESMPKGVVILDRYQYEQAKGKQQDDAFEMLVSITASLLQYGMHQKQLFTLLSPGKELWSSSQYIGAASYWQSMKHLITVEATSEQRLSSLLLRSILELPIGSTLMIVTSEASKEMLHATTKLKQRGYLPVIFYSPSAEQKKEALIARAQAFTVSGVPFYDLSSESSLYQSVGGEG